MVTLANYETCNFINEKTEKRLSYYILARLKLLFFTYLLRSQML